MKKVIRSGPSSKKLFTFTLHNLFPSEDIKVTKEASGSKKAPKKKIKKLDENPEERELHILQKRLLRIPNVKFISEVDLALYPETTDRHCFNDHYPITWAPCGIPTDKCVVGKDTYYICVKFVCSLECALRVYRREFLVERGKYSKTRKLLDELNQKMCAAMGIPYRPLEAAQDPNLLQITGTGDVHIDDYRNGCTTRYMPTEATKIAHAQELYYNLGIPDA